MKLILLMSLLLLPLISNAQDMMQKMVQMQECMQGVDQGELNNLQKQSVSLQQKVKSLCADGKNQQALEEAKMFGKTIMNSKALVKITECSKIMEGMIPKIPFSDYEKDYDNLDVCEGI